MAFWNYREELSQADRIRRSYYEILRDELDHFLLQYALIESYQNFVVRQIPFPFVEKRELKPRARIPDQEYESLNAFLVIFVEDIVPSEHKKYIRFFDVNKTTKGNLLKLKTLSLSQKFDRTWKYLESIHFYNFIKSLLPVDYALLIQRDPAGIAKGRYGLSHFHVRIDWPIADAAEDLAQSLRYISKDLYEKGDKYAEDIQKKFFEFYGLPVMAGGRRTAAIVAAQYMKKIPGITTVYVGSSEARSLIRISERGLSKAVLMRFPAEDTNQLLENNGLTPRSFKKNYVVDRLEKDSVCIFQATYAQTYHSRPPEDGKLREIKPDVNWLTVGEQHIMPKPGVWKYPPLPINI
ncbi:MAG: hypothetical protein JRF56_13495, partial [Deltaproteobacteria bacterium]|nr:hypothetical protein [Deltaproteobacteria bacterium]